MAIVFFAYVITDGDIHMFRVGSFPFCVGHVFVMFTRKRAR